jgi:hypothetical protein
VSPRLNADAVAYMLDPGRRVTDADGPGEDEGDPWRRKLAGALMRQARDGLVAEAAALERVSALEPIAADLATRYRHAARRLMPERAIATDALRRMAENLIAARRWHRETGENERFMAWTYLRAAADAWAIRVRVERTMRAYGWLE